MPTRPHPSPDSPFKTHSQEPTHRAGNHRQGISQNHWYPYSLLVLIRRFSTKPPSSAYEQLIDRVRQTSFLVPGLKITIIDENVPETGGD